MICIENLSVTAANKNTKQEVHVTKGVQTTRFSSPVEFPPPPEILSEDPLEEKEEDVHSSTVSLAYVEHFCFQPDNGMFLVCS